MHCEAWGEEGKDSSEAVHYKGILKPSQPEAEGGGGEEGWGGLFLLQLHCFMVVSCNEMVPVVVVTSRRS